MYNAPNYYESFTILDGKWKVSIEPVSTLHHHGYLIRLRKLIQGEYLHYGIWQLSGCVKHRFATLKYLLERTLWI